MAKVVDIELEEPLISHNGAIRVVRVREPKSGDVLDFGDPVMVGSTEGGSLVSVVDDAKIRRYIERLVQDDSGKQIDPNILAQGSLTDMMRIRDVVIDFFTQARQRALSLHSA